MWHTNPREVSMVFAYGSSPLWPYDIVSVKIRLRRPSHVYSVSNKVNNITLALIWKYQLPIKACCNIGYPSETHLKIKSREISFAHNLLISCQIALKICTGHGSITAVLCANFQNNLTTEMNETDERHFARFEFRTDVPYCNSPVHVYHTCYTHHRYTTDTCYKPLNRS